MRHKIIFAFTSYMADENGNRAGFRLGAAATGETGPHIRPPGQNIVPTNDRSYLPPQ